LTQKFDEIDQFEAYFSITRFSKFLEGTISITRLVTILIRPCNLFKKIIFHTDVKYIIWENAVEQNTNINTEKKSILRTFLI